MFPPLGFHTGAPVHTGWAVGSEAAAKAEGKVVGSVDGRAVARAEAEIGGGRGLHIPTTDVLRSTELPPATKHP